MLTDDRTWLIKSLRNSVLTSEAEEHYRQLLTHYSIRNSIRRMIEQA